MKLPMVLIAMVFLGTGCSPYVKDFDFPTEKKLDKNGNPIITADFDPGTLSGYLNCSRQELEVEFWSSNAFVASNHYKVRCPSKSDLWFECKQSSQLYSCKDSSGTVFHNYGLPSIFN